MSLEILKAKRWTKTHLKYPLMANVISLCRWAEDPDTIEPLGDQLPTCAHCLKLLPVVKSFLGIRE